MASDEGRAGACGSAPQTLGAKDAPFLQLRFDAGRVESAGTPTAFVGHRLGAGEAARGFGRSGTGTARP